MNRLIRLNWQVTVVFLTATLLTHLAAESIDLVYAIASSLLFAIGAGLCFLGFWNGLQRSRTEQVTLPGLLAISSSHVPTNERNLVWGAIAAQTVIAVAGASLRPFTPQAFGLLVPLFGIGLATLFGSREADFFERDDQ